MNTEIRKETPKVKIYSDETLKNQPSFGTHQKMTIKIKIYSVETSENIDPEIQKQRGYHMEFSRILPRGRPRVDLGPL